MTPDEAVNQLATVVTGDTELSPDGIYEAMAKAGVPDDVADRAYKFTQIAWGRLFLGGLGLTFPPDYFCLNASGDIVEAGQLEDEPFYVAAPGAATLSVGARRASRASLPCQRTSMPSTTLSTPGRSPRTSPSRHQQSFSWIQRRRGS